MVLIVNGTRSYVWLNVLTKTEENSRVGRRFRENLAVLDPRSVGKWPQSINRCGYCQIQVPSQSTSIDIVLLTISFLKKYYIIRSRSSTNWQNGPIFIYELKCISRRLQSFTFFNNLYYKQFTHCRKYNQFSTFNGFKFKKASHNYKF